MLSNIMLCISEDKNVLNLNFEMLVLMDNLVIKIASNNTVLVKM